MQRGPVHLGFEREIVVFIFLCLAVSDPVRLVLLFLRRLGVILIASSALMAAGCK
jgi:hypothetical protein